MTDGDDLTVLCVDPDPAARGETVVAAIDPDAQNETTFRTLSQPFDART